MRAGGANSRRGGRRPDPGPASPLLTALFSVAALAAVALLVYDHYSPAADWLVTASCVLLTGLVIVLNLATRAARSARRATAAAEAIRAASLESVSVCVITVDARGSIIEWNPAATKVFGHSRERALGTNAFELLIPEYQVDEYRLAFESLVAGDDPGVLGPFHEIRVVDAADRVFPIEATVARISGDPLLFTAFARSLTSERIKEEENRRLADIVRSSDDAIISVDLDGRVTSWNEGAHKLYGYEAGETIGHRLTELIIPPERSQELGTTFRKAINGASGLLETERLTRSGERVQVSSRAFPIRDLDGEVVGMSFSSRDLTGPEPDPTAQRGNAEREAWRSRIEDALDNSGFVFWGQPVFEATGERIQHTELLIRMRLGDEIIAPGEFLPHAEGTELIERIDQWAIAEGIRVASRMPVAINLSGRSLSTPGIGGAIHDALTEHGTDPANLKFEITETAAVENIAAARHLVEELNTAGCSVSLDDFGTGYGSFTYVRHLPIDEIKIDSSFVRDLVTEEASRRVVRSIVSLARNFYVRTVAEGIEDQETLELVREMGIDMCQGYHLGRPAPLA